jgi:hypothetical protein
MAEARASKVDNLDPGSVGVFQHYVLGFQIAMDDLVPHHQSK